MSKNKVIPSPDSITTLRVKVKNRERLQKYGGYNDTADDILSKVLDFYESNISK